MRDYDLLIILDFTTHEKLLRITLSKLMTDENKTVLVICPINIKQLI